MWRGQGGEGGGEVAKSDGERGREKCGGGREEGRGGGVGKSEGERESGREKKGLTGGEEGSEGEGMR